MARARLPERIVLARLAFVGTHWYERDVAYWTNRGRLAFLRLLALSLHALVLGGMVSALARGSPPWTAALLAVLAAGSAVGTVHRWRRARVARPDVLLGAPLPIRSAARPVTAAPRWARWYVVRWLRHTADLLVCTLTPARTAVSAGRAFLPLLDAERLARADLYAQLAARPPGRKRVRRGRRKHRRPIPEQRRGHRGREPHPASPAYAASRTVTDIDGPRAPATRSTARNRQERAVIPQRSGGVKSRSSKEPA